MGVISVFFFLSVDIIVCMKGKSRGKHIKMFIMSLGSGHMGDCKMFLFSL